MSFFFAACRRAIGAMLFCFLAVYVSPAQRVDSCKKRNLCDFNTKLSAFANGVVNLSKLGA